jgi:hypothetical protein
MKKAILRGETPEGSGGDRSPVPYEFPKVVRVYATVEVAGSTVPEPVRRFGPGRFYVPSTALGGSGGTGNDSTSP